MCGCCFYFEQALKQHRLVKLSRDVKGKDAKLDPKTLKRDAWLLKKFAALIKRKKQRGQRPRSADLQEMFDALGDTDGDDDASEVPYMYMLTYMHAQF